MTKQEILQEIIDFYTEVPGRRTAILGKHACTYNSSDGCHCAVGKYLLPELREQGTDMLGNTYVIDDLVRMNTGKDREAINELLVEEVRGYETDFWSHMQCLHDNPNFWDETTITYKGAVWIRTLCQLHWNINLHELALEGKVNDEGHNKYQVV